jgi:hypothetical protein
VTDVLVIFSPDKKSAAEAGRARPRRSGRPARPVAAAGVSRDARRLAYSQLDKHFTLRE